GVGREDFYSMLFFYLAVFLSHFSTTSLLTALALYTPDFLKRRKIKNVVGDFISKCSERNDLSATEPAFDVLEKTNKHIREEFQIFYLVGAVYYNVIMCSALLLLYLF